MKKIIKKTPAKKIKNKKVASKKVIKKALKIKTKAKPQVKNKTKLKAVKTKPKAVKKTVKRVIKAAFKKKKKFVPANLVAQENKYLTGINHFDNQNNQDKKVTKLETPPAPVKKTENITYPENKRFRQRLEFLDPGNTFEIPSLKNIKRNGIFLFSTPAASLIKIDNFDNYKGIWNNNCREYCANSVEVIVTGKVNLITANNGIIDVEGSTEIDESGETIQRKRGRKKLHAAAPKVVELDEFGEKVVKKRGRKRVEREFNWPKGKFTIEDAANLNNCEKYTIVNEINRLKKINQPIPVIIGSKPNSGKRGKPINIWQFKK